MIKFLITTAIAFVTFLCQAQVSETRAVSGFTKIKASTGVHVIFTQGTAAPLKVETDKAEKFAQIATEVSNGTLEIYVKTNRNNHQKNNFKILNVYVSQPNVSAFTADSGALFTFENTVKGPDLKVRLSSGAALEGNLEAKSIHLDADSGARFEGSVTAGDFDGNFDSAAHVTLSGKADRATLKTNSAARCNARNFKTTTAVVDADSAGSISLSVSESLLANASSGASIQYYGSPRNLTTNKDSSGNISKN